MSAMLRAAAGEILAEGREHPHASPARRGKQPIAEKCERSQFRPVGREGACDKFKHSLYLLREFFKRVNPLMTTCLT